MKTIVITITGICNMSCKYCDLQMDKQHLSLDRIKEILDKENPSDFYLIISGGEPTVHPYFASIIEYAAGKGFTGQVITNGTQPMKILIALAKGFKVNVSLNSITPELMDIKDEKTLELLKVFSNLNVPKDQITLSVVFNNNASDTIKTLNYAKEHGYSVTFNLYVQFKDNFKTNYYRSAMAVDTSELRKLIPHYEKLYIPEWFISPQHLVSYLKRYETGNYVKCDCAVNQDIIHFYKSDGMQAPCCVFANPDDCHACQGCLDLCGFEINQREGISYED